MLVMSRILVGVFLLVLGRRLYWLFVAAVGFLYGLELAPRLLPQQSETVVVIIALGLALVGALVAVVGTKVVLAMIGFMAGAGISALLLQHRPVDSGLVAAVIYLVAGLIGAALFLLLLDTALIVLSSLAGSCLIVVSAERVLEISPTAGTALGIVLAAIGILIQASLWRRRRPIKRQVERRQH